MKAGTESVKRVGLEIWQVQNPRTEQALRCFLNSLSLRAEKRKKMGKGIWKKANWDFGDFCAVRH